jgi:hypothetical protein
MTIGSAATQREARRIRDVAREYRERGYEVFVETLPPEFKTPAGGARPDVIARNKDETVLIEVKSGRWSPPETAALAKLAEVVESHPDWRLELVVTNPRTPSAEPLRGGNGSAEAWESRIEAARRALGHGDADPGLAVVMFWAGAEPMLQRAIEQVAPPSRIPRALPGVIKSLYSLGLLNERQMDELLRAYELRSLALHRGERPRISEKKLDRWAAIVAEVARTAALPAA